LETKSLTIGQPPHQKRRLFRRVGVKKTTHLSNSGLIKDNGFMKFLVGIFIIEKVHPLWVCMKNLTTHKLIS